MKRNALTFIIILAILSVAGILFIQFSFLKSSFEITEQQFEESTTIALREVAWQMLEATGQTSKFDNIDPVEKVNNHYYLVNVNNIIDPGILKAQLKEQMKRHSINIDFEYAIYDVDLEKMVYGGYICGQGDSCSHTPTYDFPVSEKYNFYFGVNFPNLSPYINHRLQSWYFMAALLVMVLFFFVYSVRVIIRQRQFSDIQKVFINNLTHELKTPISSISLSAQVLSDEKILQDPARLFEYTRIIKEQTSRLAKNIEKVLSLANLEKNKLQLIFEKIEIDAFLNKTMNQFSESITGQIAVIHLTHAATELNIWADHFHFANILQNIFENAVKYCKHQPEIDISILLKHKTIHLAIADNGIGIPKEYRKKIFNKFYRVPTGNIHDVKGFGLGLDYVKKAVKAHGWRINVSENPEGGSIFIILIPRLND